VGGGKRFQSSTVGMDAVLVGTPPSSPKVIWGMSGGLVVEERVEGIYFHQSRDCLQPSYIDEIRSHWITVVVINCTLA